MLSERILLVSGIEEDAIVQRVWSLASSPFTTGYNTARERIQTRCVVLERQVLERIEKRVKV